MLKISIFKYIDHTVMTLRFVSSHERIDRKTFMQPSREAPD